MVGDAKAVRGNERAASARIKSDARFLEMFEPFLGWFELVFVFELLERRIVEQPHSFVAKRTIAQSGRQ